MDKPIVGPNRGNAGKGRPKGSHNKTTSAIKDMVIQALDNKGGVEYLEKQADENPTAFLNLVGKVLPIQLTGDGGGAIRIAWADRALKARHAE